MQHGDPILSPAVETPARVRRAAVPLAGARKAIAAVVGCLIGSGALLFALMQFLPAHVWYDHGRAVVHTAYDHSGILPVVLAGVIAALAFANVARPRFGLALGGAIASMVLCLFIIAASFDLSHMFDRVEPLPADTVQGLALLTTFFASIAAIVLQPVVWVGTWRSHARMARARSTRPAW